MTMTQEREDIPPSLWTPGASHTPAASSLWVPGGTHHIAETNADTSHSATGPAEDTVAEKTTPEPRKTTPEPEDNAVIVSATHRNALGALSTKADQIHYVCETLGHPETAEVRRWLEAVGVEADRQYVSRLVRRWRAKRELADTGEFAAITSAMLEEAGAVDPVMSPAAARAPRKTTPAARVGDTDDTSHTVVGHVGDTDDTSHTAVAQDDDDTSHTVVAHVAQDDDTSHVVVAQDDESSELAALVRRAHARLPLQADTALLEALSDAEIGEERKLAEWEREADREMRRSAKAVEVATLKRAQATAEAIAKSEAADARWLERAVSARRRLVSPDAKLAQLYRRAELSSRALIAVVVLGMVWSGVNVQRNLVPSGDMSDPLYWLSFGIEAMISVPLIVIMVVSTTASRWGRSVDRGPVVMIELALLAATVGLNAGPHLATDLGRAAEFAVAPVMVGVMIWLHAWVSSRYATLITDSEAATSAT